MDDLSRFCCQNPQCREHGKRGSGNLYVRDRYGKDQSRRLLCCRVCGKRFSESKGTPLFGSKLPPEKCLSVLEHLAEGCGARQTARLVKVDRKTVGRLSQKAGEHARSLHDELVAFSPRDPGSADGREVVVRRQEAGELRRRRSRRRRAR
jgi:transposase-like protein